MAALNQASRKLFWSDHIQAWQSSGLSQSAYCREHDLCSQKLSYWKRKFLSSPVLVPQAANSGFARMRILTIMNTHSYHREHLLYSRIGLGVFLP